MGKSETILGNKVQNEIFNSRLQKCLRNSGYTLKALAEAICLHPKVLGRKLNGSNNAYLTHLEMRNIIITLAQWHAITTQGEVFQLLEAAQIESSIFSTEEWQTPPLSALATKNALTNLEPPALAPHNLPAPTTQLIGREKAVEQLLQLVRREAVRLVTLMGPGGCGKTRLVLQVARELVNTFAQGVWFVPLAEVSDPELMATHILKALYIEPKPDQAPLGTLISYLQNKQLLLVLDSCEQLQSIVTIHPISEMLVSAPRLKILVTSRVRLRLYGEHEFSVPSLDFPPLDAVPNTAEFAKYSAIQLFLERAQAQLPNFALTDENAATVAQICARVDGIPIALELAAARVKVLPLPLLLEKLTNARLHVLTGGAKDMPERLQTLRNTISWSYNSLSLSAQTLFRWLGIFTENCSLKTIEALIQSLTKEEGHALASEPLLDLLEDLVNSSLLSQVTTVDSQAYFVMLETLREYALEELSAHNELEKLRDWYTCYYMRKHDI